MSFFAYHTARRSIAAPPLNYAAAFLDYTVGAVDTTNLPVIGDLDFRLEVRVNLQKYVYGNFIGGNSPGNLESFCLFQRNGELLAYVQAGAQGKVVFTAVNSADQAPIGKFVRAGYERIGDTIYGLFAGQRVWAQQVGAFTVGQLTMLNICSRGGSGGGVDTFCYLDWLTLDLGTGPAGALERWLDFQFNEPDDTPALNAGKLGGSMVANKGRTGFDHLLLS